MKQYIFLFTLLFASLTAWSQEYEGSIFFKGKSLKENNDSLVISFDIHVQKHAVKDYATINLIPQLYGEDQTTTLPSVLIQGSNKRNMFSRWKTLKKKEYNLTYEEPYITLDQLRENTDTILHYNLSLPYQMWMDKAVLVLRQEITGYRDERTLNTFVLAPRVQLALRTPYQVQPRVNFIQPVQEKKQLNKQGQAYLDFQSGKSVILPNFRRNPQELKKMKEAFLEVTTNKDAQIIGLFIDGYASPEGLYETNERLSKERAFALKDYITANYNLNLDDKQVKVNWTAEDWDGLIEQINGSEIIRKQEILDIINSTSIFDGRESKLMKLAGGAPYKVMLKDMFPQLRRVEYQINYTVRDFSADEVKNLIGKKNELLSHYELYTVAQSLDKNSQQYQHIMLEVIPKQFPKDANADINAAALMIQLGEYATAKRYLEKYADKPQAWNNLGVIYLYQGDLDMAKSFFEKAITAGYTNAEYNMKEVEKKQQDNKRMERYKSLKNNN